MWIPAVIPLFGVIRSMLATSPDTVSTVFGSYILLYAVPGPHPPLPRHIIPGRGCANADKARINKVNVPLSKITLSLRIYGPPSPYMLNTQLVVEQRQCHDERSCITHAMLYLVTTNDRETEKNERK